MYLYLLFLLIQPAIARDTFQSLEYFLHLFPPLPPPLLKLGCGLSAFNNLHRFCEFTFNAEQTAEKTQADISFTNPLAVGSGFTLKVKRASWYFWSKS